MQLALKDCDIHTSDDDTNNIRYVNITTTNVNVSLKIP